MKKQFTDDERREFVRSWKLSGKTKSAYALQIGVHETTFGGWAKKYDDEASTYPNTALEAENKRLKAELRDSQQTVELLKKQPPFLLSTRGDNTRAHHLVFTPIHQ